MAERRMFHMSVVESDVFLDMPPGAQALYFHMGMHADDDGFVNGPKQICRMIGTKVKSLETLVERGFLLRFDDVVVLRHWLMANTLRKDRMRPLSYPEVAQKIYILENGLYGTVPDGESVTLWETRTNYINAENLRKKTKAHRPARGSKQNTNIKNEMCVIKNQNDGKCQPKTREDKGSQEKGSQDKTIQENLNEDKAAVAAVPAEPDAAASAADSALCIMHGELGKGVVLLTQDQVADLLDRMGIDSFDYYVDKLASFILHSGAKVKNHYATIVKWWNQDKECYK